VVDKKRINRSEAAKIFWLNFNIALENLR
jgi:hypothetical protein